jgi:hypothetical protein
MKDHISSVYGKDHGNVADARLRSQTRHSRQNIEQNMVMKLADSQKGGDLHVARTKAKEGKMTKNCHGMDVIFGFDRSRRDKRCLINISFSTPSTGTIIEHNEW